MISDLPGSAALPEPAADSSGDPMELLDRIIGELENAREEAVRLIGSVGLEEQTTLRVALRELDERLSDAKAKRDDVRQRVARTSYIRALAAEMASLRTEVEKAARGELDEKRAAQVRARIEEIRVEAQGMKLGR